MEISHREARAFHKLLEIFKNVCRNFSKSSSKNNQHLLFVSKVAQKLLEKNKNFFGLMLKYANGTAKVRFLGIFVQFCCVTSVAI